MELFSDAEAATVETPSPGADAPGGLEAALAEHEARVGELIRAASKYLSALKGWKKACQAGRMADREKAAAEALELAAQLRQPVQETTDSWSFDVRAYLEGDGWRTELKQVAEKDGLRVLQEGENLICSPVVVRSRPQSNSLAMDRKVWVCIRPAQTAGRLKQLRKRNASSNSQRFLEGLYKTYERNRQRQRDTGKDIGYVKLKDIFDQWCETPGWKTPAALPEFGQDLYAVSRAGIRSTRAGLTFEFITPSANAKEGDVFSVIAEDGRTLRFYGVRFA